MFSAENVETPDRWFIFRQLSSYDAVDSCSNVVLVNLSIRWNLRTLLMSFLYHANTNITFAA